MFDKLQVKFYRWLVRHTPGLSAYLSDDAKRCWFAAGIAYATHKPVEATWEQYPRMLFQALQAFDAFERAGQERAIDLADEPHFKSAIYEQERSTGPSHPVNPEQLKRLIGTTTLPTVTGEMRRKYLEQQRKAGQ